MEQKTKAPTELGTESIGLLLAKYALPAIIAMTASSLLNNVDRFFISRCVGPDAISGLGATMPFMNERHVNRFGGDRRRCRKKRPSMSTMSVSP